MCNFFEINNFATLRCLFDTSKSPDPANSNSETTVRAWDLGWSFLTYLLDKSYHLSFALSPASTSFNPFSTQLAGAELISSLPWVKSSSMFYCPVNKTQSLQVSGLTPRAAHRMVTSVRNFIQHHSAPGVAIPPTLIPNGLLSSWLSLSPLSSAFILFHSLIVFHFIDTQIPVCDTIPGMTSCPLHVTKEFYHAFQA